MSDADPARPAPVLSLWCAVALTTASLAEIPAQLPNPKAITSPGGSSSTVPQGRAPVPEQSWQLTSNATRLVLRRDFDVGVRLESVAQASNDPAGGETAAPFFNLPPFANKSLAGIWEIHGTHRDPPTSPGSACDKLEPNQFCIRPNAKNFHVITTAANEVTLVWPDVDIPGAQPGEKSLRVEIRVQLSTTDRVSRWWPKVTREAGTLERSSIDEIHCPILYVQPPITHRLLLPTGGGAKRLETAKEAQARARILVPNNNINVGFQGNSTTNTPLLSTNLPLDYWFRKHPNEFFELDHPNPGQLLQFQAIYNADPADRGFRTMLYLGTEDRQGFKKRFGYRAVSFASNTLMTEPLSGPVPVTDWRWMWRHIYLPPFEDMVDSPGTMDEWGNTFEAPYPAVIGVLKAQSDDFWYDAAAFYREFVESSGMFATTFERSPNVSPRFRGPAQFTAHTLVDHTANPTSIMPRALAISRAYQEYLQQSFPAAAAATEHFAFVGNYRSDHAYGHPDFPVGAPVNEIIPQLRSDSFMDPATHPMVAAAHQNGIHVSGYTEGIQVLAPSGWELPSSTQLFDRSGQHVISPAACYLDFGDFDAQGAGITTWLSQGPGLPGTGMNGPCNLIAQAARFRGLYIDGVAGNGFWMGYENPAMPGSLNHIPHGGTYSTEGRRKTLRDARAMLESLPHNRGQEDHVYLMSEAVQEFSAGELDLVQQGLDYVPFHMTDYESTFFTSPLAGLGDIEQHMVGVPAASRTWSAPLWTTVYHEYQPSNTMVMAITNAGLANGPLYPSGQGACYRAGVQPNEWEDLLCFSYAAYWVAGQKPMMIPYVHDHDYSPIWWANGQLQWDDPSGACGRALDFIGRLHALYAGSSTTAPSTQAVGRFNLFGRAERPLVADPGNGEQVNPSFASYWNTQVSLPPQSCPPSGTDHSSVVLPYIEQSINVHAVLAHVLDHPVPAVLHSVWRHEGNAVIVPPAAPPGTTAAAPRLGILLANWTDTAQQWQAAFRPTLYDIPAGTSYTIREVDALGQTIAALGSATAPAPLLIDITLPARNDALDRRAATVLVVDY